MVFALNSIIKIVRLTLQQQGELLLKGPNVFLGYWNRPEINKASFTEDGWFKTGDVVYVDKRGNFYVTDRIKELIKYSKRHHQTARICKASSC